jgi:hypothetical protein
LASLTFETRQAGVRRLLKAKRRVAGNLIKDEKSPTLICTWSWKDLRTPDPIWVMHPLAAHRKPFAETYILQHASPSDEASFIKAIGRHTMVKYDFQAVNEAHERLI